MKPLPLADLGQRICIMGPSNAGKSTLARAIGRKLDLPIVYLDVLRHEPHSNWVAKPFAEFELSHAEAIAADRWVMEGNYSALYPSRLARATGIILLGSEPWKSVFRYVRRTLFEGPERAGQLEGGSDSLKWSLAHYILIVQPRNHSRDRKTLAASGLPMVELRSMRELGSLYEAWQLNR